MNLDQSRIIYQQPTSIKHLIVLLDSTLLCRNLPYSPHQVTRAGDGRSEGTGGTGEL